MRNESMPQREPRTYTEYLNMYLVESSQREVTISLKAVKVLSQSNSEELQNMTMALANYAFGQSQQVTLEIENLISRMK